MRVLPGPEFDADAVTQFFSTHIRRKGVFRRRPIETLIVHPLKWRVFRRVRWQCSSQETSTNQPKVSLIDEQGASIVEDFNERLLLWRPHYAKLKLIKPFQQMPSFPEAQAIDEEKLQSVIVDLIEKRRATQQFLGEITPELKRLQTDPLTALAAVLPRRILRGKREDELAEERKLAHSTLLATSLMTNCSIEDTIEVGILEEQVAIGTIMAEFQNLETKIARLVFLETAGVKSLFDAFTAGRALTRLCQLNRNVVKLFK